MNVIDARTFDPTGEVVTIKEILGDNRVIVLARADEEKVGAIRRPMRTAFSARRRPCPGPTSAAASSSNA